MTQQDKELLLNDLCARLPYGVEVFYSETVPISTLKTINAEKEDCIVYDHTQWYRHTKFHIETVKPYLRPMSSMTEEEEKEVNKLLGYRKNINGYGGILCSGWNGDVIVNIDVIVSYLNWLNAHHFDYRGLIEKGLALEAPEDMYKN